MGGEEGRTGQEIIDSPAYILCPGPCPVTPPGISIPPVRGKMPEGVYKTALDITVHPINFFLHISGRFVVIGFGTGQVNIPVGHIKIPARKNRLSLSQAVSEKRKRRGPNFAGTPAF